MAKKAAKKASKKATKNVAASYTQRMTFENYELIRRRERL
jgi:hypothetical protein